MTEENVRSTQGVFQFELSGDGGGTWYIDLKNKGGSTGFGKPPGTADVVMSMSSADFVKMFTGEGQRPLSDRCPENLLLMGEETGISLSALGWRSFQLFVAQEKVQARSACIFLDSCVL
ncbi:PREDICTED: hydroxysteroid dehydrogenase-like protein 2 [Lepidothrix coronata]|nr:PREDICTED: hydroxysteroid dehydrogenase-like protein 2 [Lepidothrix coronata]